MKWVTWENVGVDRIACAWLIKRSIDPAPLTRRQVLRTASVPGSLDRRLEDFKACCLAANGWGILARDLVNGQ